MIRLTREFAREREINLGRGVVFRFRALTYLDYREIEARAARLARDLVKAGDVREAFDEVLLGDRDPPEMIDRLEAKANEIMLDALVDRAGLGWEGVADADGAPAALTPANWRLFRDLCPNEASRVYYAMIAPYSEATAEGNASAPSPAGAPAGANGAAPTAP